MAKILIVDNENGMLDSFWTFLSDSGYGVTISTNANETLQRSDGSEFDLMLINMNLLEKNWAANLGRIRKDYPHMDVIVTSRDAKEETVVAAVKQGAYDFLRNPISNAELMISINRVMEKRKLEGERKRAEDSSGVVEQRFHAIVGKSADGILVVDSEGIIRFVNPAAEEILSHKAEFLLGEQFGIAVATDEMTEINTLRENGEMGFAEMSVVETEWESKSARLIFLHDITEIRKVRKRADLLANLVEKARHDMMFIVKPDGMFVECNALARNTFGYTHSEIAALNMHALFKFETAKGWDDISKYLVQQSHWRGSLVAVSKEGEIFPAEISISSTKNESDGDVRMICFVRNVTREAEIDRLKTDFIAIASHELRTPMTSIKNSIDIILKKKAGEINAKQKKFLQMAERNVNRLSVLVNDLLDLSKIDAGKMLLHYKEVDIGHCISNAISLAKSAADAKNISIKLGKYSDIPPIYVDSAKIEEVLVNLIDNAIKFTPNSGSITVDALLLNEATNQPESASQALRISITDTGIGMPKNVMAHLFKRFYQVESSLSVEKRAGTGLGLAICKGIVEAHGGTIQCTSQVHQGSTFSFTIPYVDQAGQFHIYLNEKLSLAKHNHVPLSILIVRIQDMSRLCEIYGTEEIENILKSVEGLIAEGITSKDTINIVPTKGELILTLPDTDCQGASTLQKRIEQYIDTNEIVIKGGQYSPSFEFGNASFPEDGESVAELIDATKPKSE